MILSQQDINRPLRGSAWIRSARRYAAQAHARAVADHYEEPAAVPEHKFAEGRPGFDPEESQRLLAGRPPQS